MEKDNIHDKNISQDTSDINERRQKDLLNKNDDPYPFYSFYKIKETLIQNDCDTEMINRIIKVKNELLGEEYMNSTNKTNKNLLIYQSDNTFKHEYEKMKDIDNYLKMKRNRNDDKKNFIITQILFFLK